MPYITIKQPPSYHQISFEEMMAGVQDLSQYVFANTSNTRTYFAEMVNPKLLENTDIRHMISLLAAFNQTHGQGFMPTRANLVLGENKEVRVTFDANGNVMMTEDDSGDDAW